MRSRRLLVFLFISAPLFIAAQVSYYTRIDSAEMLEMREKKIKIRYSLKQPFDSVTGKLNTKGPFDTTYTEYDRMGRELQFSSVDNEGVRYHSFLFYDLTGKVVRHFHFQLDSTSGYVHYYTYNDKGQVVRELACKRDNSREVPYKEDTFYYNESGQLIRQESYYVRDNDSRKLESTHLFSYFSGAENLEIEVHLRANGDTFNVDSTYRNRYNKSYHHRGVHYQSNNRNKPNSKILVCDYGLTIDTMGARVKRTHVAKFFDYDHGKLNQLDTDTSFYDRHENLMESRGEKYIDIFFYDDNGEYDFMIRYNRQYQPLYRRTASSYIYYQ